MRNTIWPRKAKVAQDDADSRIRVLRGVDNGRSLIADVVVIGSGAGGAAVAGELRRGGASVVMVEAGGPVNGLEFGSHVHTQFPAEAQLEAEYGPAVWSKLTPFQGADSPTPGLEGMASAHGVGGLLSFWSHMCALPDYASEGEPTIDPTSMAKLWHRAMGLLWANRDIEGGVRQRRLEAAIAALYPGLPDGRGVQQLPIAARRAADGAVEYAGISALLDGGNDLTLPNLTILTEHPVRRIEMSNGVAIGVTAANLAGTSVVDVRAAYVVVAGGALGAPQLLHASGIRPPALGRYVTDHTMLTSRVLLSRDLLESIPPDDPTFSVWVPASTERPIHTQVARGWVSAAPFLADFPHRETADICQFAGVDPDPDNRLTFSDDRPDLWGMPSVSAEFRLGKDDRSRLEFAARDHTRIANAIRDPRVGFSMSVAPPGGSLHVMGTCRLGASDLDSTADSRGKVWGTSNVYVAGNGVISTRNAGNPTVNTVALALRTADAILGRVSP